jgi:cell division septation protein DedD
MRPDMDEYEELGNGKAGGSRAMSWMVLSVAVLGFSALAYYAYHSGSKAPAEGETLIVEADPSPIKTAPETADGEQFPNQDKTIYDVIAPGGNSTTGEKLLPDAEQPVAAANMEDSEDAPSAATPAVQPATAATAPEPSTTTFVAGATEAKNNGIAEAPAAAVNVVQSVSEQPVATSSKAIAEAATKAVEKSYAAPEMINEKKAVAKVEPVKAEPKKEAKPKAEKPVVKQVAGGAYKIQLGAFKSEEEAQAAWKKISSKHGLSGSPTIVQAEVNGGTFYRLRSGSYGSADAAKAACASLGGQACFPVK